MELNQLIMESLKLNLSKKQQTSVQFGGTKEASMKDVNVGSKEQSSLEGGLTGDISKDNKNPQGEGGKEIVKSNPKLASAVVAGIIGKGGANIKPNPNVKFTPPAPATK